MGCRLLVAKHLLTLVSCEQKWKDILTGPKALEQRCVWDLGTLSFSLKCPSVSQWSLVRSLHFVRVVKKLVTPALMRREDAESTLLIRWLS